MCACQVTMATLGMGSVNPAVVTSMGQGHRSATLIQVSTCQVTIETLGMGSVNPVAATSMEQTHRSACLAIIATRG